jgi:6-phosphogluconolactonase (cycloisomerase 2 family)
MGTMLTVRLPFGLFAPRSRRVVVCAVVALLSLVSCASASAALNLTGTWSAVYHCEVGACAGTEITATDSLSQAEGSEVVSGSNRIETVAGTLTGNTFVYRSSTTGYEAKGTFTVAPNGQSWSGHLEDSNGTEGTYTAALDPAPPGSLQQLPSPFNCVGEQGYNEEHSIGCATLLPKEAINAAYQALLSPDGRNVYSVAISGALVEYSRNQASGALTEIGCVTGAAVACAPENSTTEAIALGGPAAIAISPDGLSAYVVTQASHNALVFFARDPTTGLLTEQGCISEEASVAAECKTPKGKGLNNPYGVTVSPDGRNVYVASHDDQAVAEFSRDTTTGAVTQLPAPDECVSSTALSGCATDTALGLEKAIGVAVSPDDKNVYVAAGATEGEGAVVAFERNLETGALTQLAGKEGCVSTANAACEKGTAIDGPEDLIISPDGHNVYTNSSQNSAVLEFRRESSGALAQLASPDACVMNEPVTAGCSQAKGLKDALGVAISPGGENVYASSPEEDDEVAFIRDPETGDLTQFAAPFECVGKIEHTSCEITDVKGIAGARRVTVSPDGMNLYIAGQNDHTVVELRRAVTPVVSSLSVSGGPETGGTSVTITGSGFLEGAFVDFGAGPATNVTVNSASSITATSPGGSGTVDVTVNTYAGTSAITSGDRFSYVGSPVLPSAKVASLLTPIVSVGPLIVPPPVLVKSGNVAPVSGTVLVKLPGTSKFVPLSSLRQVPFGSIIEATHGTVSVTTAEPGGKTQTGEFFEGEFILRQGANGVVIAELTGGNFAVCPTKQERSHIARAGSAPAASAASASGSHVVRKLWANAHGKFSTKGNYAAGAVQGTEWLTEDLCDGTLIKVTRDKVAVTNLVNHRHVEVTTGHHYLAKAP